MLTYNTLYLHGAGFFAASDTLITSRFEPDLNAALAVTLFVLLTVPVLRKTLKMKQKFK